MVPRHGRGGRMSVARTSPVPWAPGLGIEANGINVIDESERKGTPAELFWPWCASNVSVLAVSYGAFVLGFGLGLWQALVATVVGAVLSFLLVGLRLDRRQARLGARRWCCRGRRSAGSATRSRASCPTCCWWAGRRCWSRWRRSPPPPCSAGSAGATATSPRSSRSCVVAGVIVAAGILGFDAIMKLQKWLTIAMIVVTAGLHRADRRPRLDGCGRPRSRPAALSAVVGASILVMTGLRGRLGELRGRLLALPAAHRLDPRRGRLADASAGACPS